METIAKWLKLCGCLCRIEIGGVRVPVKISPLLKFKTKNFTRQKSRSLLSVNYKNTNGKNLDDKFSWFGPELSIELHDMLCNRSNQTITQIAVTVEPNDVEITPSLQMTRKKGWIFILYTSTAEDLQSKIFLKLKSTDIKYRTVTRCINKIF